MPAAGRGSCVVNTLERAIPTAVGKRNVAHRIISWKRLRHSGSRSVRRFRTRANGNTGHRHTFKLIYKPSRRSTAPLLNSRPPNKKNHNRPLGWQQIHRAHNSHKKRKPFAIVNRVKVYVGVFAVPLASTANPVASVPRRTKEARRSKAT